MIVLKGYAVKCLVLPMNLSKGIRCCKIGDRFQAEHVLLLFLVKNTVRTVIDTDTINIKSHCAHTYQVLTASCVTEQFSASFSTRESDAMRRCVKQLRRFTMKERKKKDRFTGKNEKSGGEWGGGDKRKK